MEEKTADIDILEDYIELIEKGYCEDCNELCNISTAPAYPSKAVAQAISNLIAENKELKEEELDYTTVYLNGVYDEREKWQKKIKEMKERNKRQQENLKIANKKIAAQRGQLMMLNKAYIPKSKVEELLNKYKYTEIEDSEKIIQFYKDLQSLLGKE